MLNLNECKEILNKGKQNYKDAEVELIRKHLIILAKLEVEQYFKQKTNEDSGNHESGINR